MAIRYKSIRLQAYDLAYFDSEEAGKPVLVLVHGVGVSTRYLLPLARELRADYRVVALDFPGFGRSNQYASPRRIQEFVDIHHMFQEALGIRPDALIGNSFGAQVLVELVQYPGDAKSAVLISPSINANERSVPQQTVRLVQDMIIEPKSSDSALLIKDYVDAGVAGVYNSLKAAMNHPIEDAIGKVSGPLLIIRGENDPIVPSKWTQTLQERAPGAQLMTIKGGAHVLNAHNPKQTADIIRDFLFSLQLH